MLGITQEGIRPARVVDVVAYGGDEQGQEIHGIQTRFHTLGAAEVGGRLEHVCRMGGVVVTVAAVVV